MQTWCRHGMPRWGRVSPLSSCSLWACHTQPSSSIGPCPAFSAVRQSPLCSTLSLLYRGSDVCKPTGIAVQNVLLYLCSLLYTHKWLQEPVCPFASRCLVAFSTKLLSAQILHGTIVVHPPNLFCYTNRLSSVTFCCHPPSESAYRRFHPTDVISW